MFFIARDTGTTEGRSKARAGPATGRGAGRGGPKRRGEPHDHLSDHGDSLSHSPVVHSSTLVSCPGVLNPSPPQKKERPEHVRDGLSSLALVRLRSPGRADLTWRRAPSTSAPTSRAPASPAPPALWPFLVLASSPAVGGPVSRRGVAIGTHQSSFCFFSSRSPRDVPPKQPRPLLKKRLKANHTFPEKSRGDLEARDNGW